jgi:hypothetical protein
MTALEIITSPEEIESYATAWKKYFSEEFLKVFSWKRTFKQSLAGRYRLAQIAKSKFNKHFIPSIWDNGAPLPHNWFHWTLSHTEKAVMIVLDTRTIWCDIEKIEEKGEYTKNQFSEKEYSIMWGRGWNEFYRIWTAKEALIKIIPLSTLWLIESMELVKKENTVSSISWISFDYILTCRLKWKDWKISTWIQWEYCYAFVREKNIFQRMKENIFG